MNVKLDLSILNCMLDYEMCEYAIMMIEILFDSDLWFVKYRFALMLPTFISMLVNEVYCIQHQLLIQLLIIFADTQF